MSNPFYSSETGFVFNWIYLKVFELQCLHCHLGKGRVLKTNWFLLLKSHLDIDFSLFNPTKMISVLYIV